VDVAIHHYELTVRWRGNLGEGTSAYGRYSRDHELAGPAKGALIEGSSDRAFRGDAARYNPEELLVGALSACHMLWVLHLAAVASIVITDYRDNATGSMTEHGDGSGEFTSVTLHPVMTISDPRRKSDALALHERAHEMCFIARSVKFPVHHEAEILVGSGN
jgi:organic hydroperoxide reductase OsmC/OhrA